MAHKQEQISTTYQEPHQGLRQVGKQINIAKRLEWGWQVGKQTIQAQVETDARMRNTHSGGNKCSGRENTAYHNVEVEIKLL